MPTINGKFFGQLVLDAGNYIGNNCIKLFLDPEHQRPVNFSLQDIWNLLLFEVPTEQDGEVELFTIPDCIANLEPNETFQWVVYGEFRSSWIEEWEVFTFGLVGPIDGKPSVTDFLTCEMKPISPKTLKNNSPFRILFSFCNNDAWQKLLKTKNEKGQVTFYGTFTSYGRHR